MKKTIFSIMALAGMVTMATAQTQYPGRVGVNTSEPKATLDVAGKPADTSVTDGLIAPRITGNELAAKDALYTADQTGALVYATAAASPTTAKTINVTAAGYFYFDGTVWVAVPKPIPGGTGADATVDAWIDDSANTMVKLGTLSNGTTARPAGTEFVALDNGNVGIGTNNPTSNLHVYQKPGATGGTSIRAEISGTVANSQANVTAATENVNSIAIYSQSPTRSGSRFGNPIAGTTELITLPNTYTGNMNIGTAGPGNIILGTNNIERVRIEATTGYVGINTKTPLNRLDVNGNQTIGANYAGTVTAPTNGLLVEGRVGFGDVAPPTKLSLLGNGFINQAISFQNTSNSNTDRWQIGSRTFSSSSTSAQTSAFSIENSSSLSLLAINYNNGDMAVGQYINWGTVIPKAKLDVSSGYILVGSADATGDAAPVNGMIRYNSTTNKFQGYAAGAWVDLH